MNKVHCDVCDNVINSEESTINFTRCIQVNEVYLEMHFSYFEQTITDISQSKKDICEDCIAESFNQLYHQHFLPSKGLES